MHSYLTCQVVGWSPFIKVTHWVFILFLHCCHLYVILHNTCNLTSGSMYLKKQLSLPVFKDWFNLGKLFLNHLDRDSVWVVVGQGWVMWGSPQAGQLEGSMVGYLMGSLSVPAAWFCRHVGLEPQSEVSPGARIMGRWPNVRISEWVWCKVPSWVSWFSFIYSRPILFRNTFHTKSSIQSIS